MANNNYQNNNQQNQDRAATRTTSLVFDKRQLEGCIDGVSIPMTMTGIVMKDTTNSLADKIVNLFANEFNIPELEHCLFYPRKDKTGEIVDFDAVLYFNTNIGNKTKNIFKNGTGGGRTNDGRPDLMRLAGSRTANGAFDINDNFRKTFASVALTDRDGKIIIKAVPDSPNIAIVECSFFRLLALCFGITSNDPYDFTIAECWPLNNNSGTPDFGLVIIKEMISGHTRRAKSGTNYAALDTKRINGHNYR